MLRADPDLVLHHEDAIHPNALGSFVSANVLFRTMFREPVAGHTPPEGMDAETTAELLEAIDRMDFQALIDQ